MAGNSCNWIGVTKLSDLLDSAIAVATVSNPSSAAASPAQRRHDCQPSIGRHSGTPVGERIIWGRLGMDTTEVDDHRRLKTRSERCVNPQPPMGCRSESPVRHSRIELSLADRVIGMAEPFPPAESLVSRRSLAFGSAALQQISASRNIGQDREASPTPSPRLFTPSPP